MRALALLTTCLSLSLSLATSVLALVSQPLVPLVLEPLDLGRVKASGWLHEQLLLSASGLGGHLMDFWTYVSDSAWLGGTSEYSLLHEAFPYWLNYMVPLAYSLDDARLLAQVHKASEGVLTLAEAQADGWIGYEQGTARNLWPRPLVCMALMQLAQADDAYAGRVVAVLRRFARLVDAMLADNYRGFRYHEGDNFTEDGTGWGLARAQDLMIPLMWLYEAHPSSDEADQAALLRVFTRLYEGGVNWDYWFREDVFPRGRPFLLNKTFYENQPWQYFHGVNEAMGLKATAVYRRFLHNDTMAQLARQGVNWTFAYHGSASGSILADEGINGQMGYMGYETCTTVEAMYSLAYLYQALGDSTFADRAERAAFNALPGAVTADWWARQYVGQPNQPWTRELTNDPFEDVNLRAQQYTLEGNYPCCTVNHPQGYPKFLAAVFTHGPTGWGGLAHALLAPASVDVVLRDETGTGTGTRVRINVTTRYPFGMVLHYDVAANASFTLAVRVPAWADAASSVAVDNGPAARVRPDPVTRLHAVSLPAGTSTLRYELRAELRVEPRPNATVAVHHGALVYALDLPAVNSSTVPLHYKTGKPWPADQVPLPARDWTMVNTTPWNYAIDPSTLEYHDSEAGAGTEHDSDLPSPIWSPAAPPNYVTGKACLIDWPLYLNTTPDEAPPAASRKCLGPVTDVVLRPYGSTKLHVGDIPVIDLSGRIEPGP